MADEARGTGDKDGIGHGLPSLRASDNPAAHRGCRPKRSNKANYRINRPKSPGEWPAGNVAASKGPRCDSGRQIPVEQRQGALNRQTSGLALDYPYTRKQLMKITMIGAGYVGLVSGACFSDFGHEVIVVDKDPSKLDRLAQGVMPIYEPGLADLVKRNEAANRLSYASELGEAVEDADAIFIAVGTPIAARRRLRRSLLRL